MRIGPMFKWFGSKWQSARYYPAPQCSRIVEPFCGGAGYALNHVDRDVQIWDSNVNLQALWRWLIRDATETAVRDIPIGLPEGTDIRAIGLSAGQAQLLKHWQRTNNYGECWTVSPWGHLPGQWTENTRARVAEQVSAIRHWRFEAPTWGEMGDATVFVDPPYQYNYRYGARDLDFTALALSVTAIPLSSQVIVCEAIGKNGERPSWLPFADFRRSVTSRRKAEQSHHSTELLWHRPAEMNSSAG